MLRTQKIACCLGVLGLIPFIAPVIMVFLYDNEIGQIAETLHMIYGALIISFIGGVQWGYAIRQGVSARASQYIIGVIPTLAILGTLLMGLMIEAYHVSLVFAGLLLLQAIIDQRIYVEKWFLRLRWGLTIVASSSFIAMTIFQYFGHDFFGITTDYIQSMFNESST